MIHGKDKCGALFVKRLVGLATSRYAWPESSHCTHCIPPCAQVCHSAEWQDAEFWTMVLQALSMAAKPPFLEYDYVDSRTLSLV